MRQMLRPHPESSCRAATRIEVDVARLRNDSLVLSYIVTGTIGDVRMPATTTPERADELWQHTCFEAFIRTSPNGPYYELNFSPSTQWAVYRFSGYRDGMHAATEYGAPRIDVRSSPDRYTLEASLTVPDLPHEAPWRLGLSAMIEETNGNKSYWALAHPPGKADFHHPDCFAMNFPEA
jgi:hypothetical protein